MSLCDAIWIWSLCWVIVLSIMICYALFLFGVSFVCLYLFALFCGLFSLFCWFVFILAGCILFCFICACWFGYFCLGFGLILACCLLRLFAFVVCLVVFVEYSCMLDECLCCFCGCLLWYVLIPALLVWFLFGLFGCVCYLWFLVWFG